jgi:hypothetical protein
MERESIEYNLDDYSDLAIWLRNHWGASIRFPNGCGIILINDDGLIWGWSPYGIDWGCNHKEGWEEKVRNWLEFWDEPRDESGSIRKI